MMRHENISRANIDRFRNNLHENTFANSSPQNYDIVIKLLKLHIHTLSFPATNNIQTLPRKSLGAAMGPFLHKLFIKIYVVKFVKQSKISFSLLKMTTRNISLLFLISVGRRDEENTGKRGTRLHTTN
jgi:hypothetical protein